VKNKLFLTKSLLLQTFIGCVLCLSLLVPSVLGYSSHPLMSWVGIGLYLVLMPTLTILLEIYVK